MIARLAGTLVERTPDRAIVDCGGVGYRCLCSLTTTAALPEPPAEVVLLVHTVVREDAIQLIGFATAPERDVFQMLTQVDGVGPKVALAVLSGLPPAELAQAIIRQDNKTLTQISGVGPKLAARLIVELADKLAKRPDIAGSVPGVIAPSTARSGVERSELFQVLLAAGHRPLDITNAIDRLGELGLTGAELQIQFREAAKLLTRGKLTRMTPS